MPLQVGLRKLLDAEGEVNVMKQELIALQPKLIETGGLAHYLGLLHPHQQKWKTGGSRGVGAYACPGGRPSMAACTPCVLSTLPHPCVHAGKEVEDTLRIVDAQTQEASAKKQVVEGEEAIASEKAAAAKAIKVNDWVLVTQPCGQQDGLWQAHAIVLPCSIYTGCCRNHLT